MESDGDLVEAVLAGDTDAYAALVRRYERSAVSVAWRVLGDPEAAEEAAQDAFVTAYEKLGELRQPGAYGGWLTRIVRRRALRLRDERARQLSLDTETVNTATDDASDSGLLDLVERLPEHEREVVMLRYFDQLDTTAIAAALNRPLGTVTKQLSRAHQRLRDWLEQDGSP